VVVEVEGPEVAAEAAEGVAEEDHQVGAYHLQQVQDWDKQEEPN